MIRLLLTSTGGGRSAQTIKLLQELGAYVIAVNTKPAETSADAFEMVPFGHDPAYKDRLVEVVKKHSANVVLPCSDEEAWALTSNREEVEGAGAILASPGMAAMKIMRDKFATSDLLNMSGIPHPTSLKVVSQAELDSAVNLLLRRFGTVAIKPLSSRGSRGVYIVDNDITGIRQEEGHRESYCSVAGYKSLQLGPTEAEPLLVTEGLKGPAYDIDVLAKGGKVIAVCPRWRVNPAGIPYKGSTVMLNPGLINMAERVSDALKADYLFDIDVMSDAGGNPKVIEVNCRPSGSIADGGTKMLKPFLDLTVREKFLQAC